MIICSKTYDEERALYAQEGLTLVKCEFKGAADGESALKESKNIEAVNCLFALRYPLWHVKKFGLFNCEMTATCRAAIWYSSSGDIRDCVLGGIKALRECSNVKLCGCRVTSEEFGWKCADILVEDSEIESEYLFLECRDVRADNIKMKGKYSFQYLSDGVVKNSVLDTKDAFWHSKNVRLENCVVKGEYLGWYSENLTLVNCAIYGTQPLCYCKNLTLENCTMTGTDLAFEMSDVRADVRGNIDSVKNPLSGQIKADRIGEVINTLAQGRMNCRIEQTNNPVQ